MLFNLPLLCNHLESTNSGVTETVYFSDLGQHQESKWMEYNFQAEPEFLICKNTAIFPISLKNVLIDKEGWARK